MSVVNVFSGVFKRRRAPADRTDERHGEERREHLPRRAIAHLAPIRERGRDRAGHSATVFVAFAAIAFIPVKSRAGNAREARRPRPS